MTRRNKVLLGVLVAAVLALLIALCFVGNTFARYTLSEKETVTAEIANWGVVLTEDTTDSNVSSGTESNETTYEVKNLQPKAADFDDSDPRINADNFVCVATLTNVGDVSAAVSITSSDDAITATYRDYDSTKGTAYGASADSNNKYTPGTDKGYANTTTTGSEYANEITDHLTAEVLYSTSSELTSPESASSFDSSYTLEKNNTIYLYLSVEWISDLEDENNTGTYLNGDGFDTWCGTWVEGFTFGVTITAYQAS